MSDLYTPQLEHCPTPRALCGLYDDNDLYTPQLERCPTPRALCGLYDDNEGADSSAAGKQVVVLGLDPSDDPPKNPDVVKEGTDNQQDPSTPESVDDGCLSAFDGEGTRQSPILIDDEDNEPLAKPETSSQLKKRKQSPGSPNSPSAKKRKRSPESPKPRSSKCESVSLMIDSVEWEEHGETRKYRWNREKGLWVSDTACDDGFRYVESEVLIAEATTNLVIGVRRSGLYPVQCGWEEEKNMFIGTHVLHGEKTYEISIEQMCSMLWIQKGTGVCRRG